MTKKPILIWYTSPESVQIRINRVKNRSNVTNLSFSLTEVLVLNSLVGLLTGAVTYLYFYQ